MAQEGATPTPRRRRPKRDASRREGFVAWKPTNSSWPTLPSASEPLWQARPPAKPLRRSNATHSSKGSPVQLE
eukprot:7900642-Pyramimonas_sp.AAC.1